MPPRRKRVKPAKQKTTLEDVRVNPPLTKVVRLADLFNDAREINPSDVRRTAIEILYNRYNVKDVLTYRDEMYAIIEG